MNLALAREDGKKAGKSGKLAREAFLRGGALKDSALQLRTIASEDRSTLYFKYNEKYPAEFDSAGYFSFEQIFGAFVLRRLRKYYRESAKVG